MLRVGLAGLGTVGSGVVAILQSKRELLARRAGTPIELTAIASRTAKPEITGDLPFCSDVEDLLRRDDVDVVVEAIGGTEHALQLTTSALDAGRHVVTANKAVIAEYGNALFEHAEAARVQLRFEAAVAGGIPVIKALREGLAANHIEWLAGIINGTTNYILSSMCRDGREFAEVLAEAQALGYAEADPSFDIEGIDAAHKLTILSALAFGSRLDFGAVYTEGIAAITREDFEYAAALGYSIKHVGIARSTDGGVELRVHPALLPADHLISRVDGVTNAVAIASDAAAVSMYTGPGAGGAATASAIVADLVDLARNPASGPFGLGMEFSTLADLPIIGIARVSCPHYLRIPVLDQPGAMSTVSQTLASRGVSIESIIQKHAAVRHQGNGDWVPIALVTDRVAGQVIGEAIEALRQLPVVAGPISHIRVEPLDT